ncbi:serine/threonine-protein phosphatase 7 long form homolog [Abrus precatorius]|uniref:Serine/threonine-protein phosphatase 7 long form homolog n=1 Tax=Abrus precatorius TaxID=3816 RepID=A0A8B8L8R4_ABRPR|nr:serine/threonine-protein phosphatase 7 long form homolog [Abrus precatorius]
MASSSQQSRVINPGLEDLSLLRFQSIHVSEHIWDRRDHPTLRVRKSPNIPGGLEGIPEEIIPHLELAGFVGVANLSKLPVDVGLITALVEKWRPETHTFHMPPGECTITLQDVAIILGLRIDGTPVIAPTGGSEAFVGSFLKMSWLDEHFTHIAMHNQTPLQITRFARAYILRLIGGFMLPDHSSSRVSVRYLPLLEDFELTGQYSWGSAVLGYLYRELCMATNIDRVAIGGLTALIVIWAWDRFPQIAPINPPYSRPYLPYGVRWLSHGIRRGKKYVHYYRYIFDRLARDGIVWVPYNMELINILPPICRDAMDLWRAVVPLICFQVCEWHQPDRVMRQFGMVQHIPRTPYQPDQLHDLTLRGKTGEDWSAKFSAMLEIWESRRLWVLTNEPQYGLLSSNSEYMRWYVSHTRRWMTREAAVSALSGDVMERLYYLSTDGQDSFTINKLKDLSESLLSLKKEQDRILEPISTSDPPLQSGNPVNPDLHIDQLYQRREGRGLAHRRRQVQAAEWAVPGTHHPLEHPSSPFTGTEDYIPRPDFFFTPLHEHHSLLTPGAPYSQVDPIPSNIHPIELGIDLNAKFGAVADLGYVRRNPHRGARDRQRQCILTPDDHHHEAHRGDSNDMFLCSNLF